MKLKEALPNFNDTFLARSKSKNFHFPSIEPVNRQDLEINVDRMSNGSFRATILSVRGERYGTKLTHPKDFMASGRTPEEAKEELFKKLKI